MFSQLIIDDHTLAIIRMVRQLKADTTTDSKAQIARLKRQLPMIIWQCSGFSETVSRGGKGTLGSWRKQAAARLNGLFMLDIDHVEQPAELFHSWWKPYLDHLLEDGHFHQNGEAISLWAESLGVLLVHITPSGQGLRLVAVADAERGNLADNQEWLANKLGVEADQSCKDASRVSFCPMFDDILFINKDKLFNYENPTFDEKYGDKYRQGYSQPTGGTAQGNSNGAAHSVHDARTGAVTPVGTAAEGSGADNVQPDGQLDEIINRGYHGVSYETIINSWLQLIEGGEPSVGDRHRVLLRLAADLRYICDNNPHMVEGAIKKHHLGKSYVSDADGQSDLTRIAADACSKSMWQRLPKRFLPVLEHAGVQLAANADGAEGAEEVPAIDYEGYARKLIPLLNDSPGLREAVADLPDRLKLAGVLAAGAMLGTYLTRTWWEHFDGRLYRLSYLVYIVGAAASGKSFLTLMDSLLMAPMQSADRVGREAERQYKEKQKARKANEKLPDMPHPVVRYCPSTTSNAILYRRLQDAVDNDITDPATNEPLHMHLITVESELATALRSQVGSWAGKSDLELKSFHNEKAGVDFANAESTNGIMQINWNQVISGTQESMSRKITPKNVLDGLVTRLALFLMPANDYVMIERRKVLRNHERECLLRSLGYDLEQVKGELRVPRLVDFCYEYEEQLTRQARIEQDRCLDYFRKRIPVIMMRYALVRIVLRQLDAAKKGEDLMVDDSDLEFARLIGDWCLQMQVHMFGQMVMDALAREAQAFQPRAYRYKTRELFNRLPTEITIELLMADSAVKSKYNVKTLLARWLKDGLIERINDNEYRKKIERL